MLSKLSKSPALWKEKDEVKWDARWGCVLAFPAPPPPPPPRPPDPSPSRSLVVEEPWEESREVEEDDSRRWASVDSFCRDRGDDFGLPKPATE